MHILYLHQYFTIPQVSGGTRSYDFSRKWVEHGHRVTLLTSSAHIGNTYPLDKKKRINTIDIDGIDVVCITVSYSQNMSYLRRIISLLLFMLYASVFLLEKGSFDLVFATSTPLTIAVPALIARVRNRIPFVFEVRDLWPEYPEDFGIIKNKAVIRLLEGFCRHIYNAADHIVAISNSMAGRIISKYGIKGDKISVVPLGSCNYLLHHLDYCKVREYISEYGLENKFVIGYAGTIGYVNNLDSVINIAEALKDFDDIIFIIAGEGKEKRRLQEEAMKKNLSNVKFIGKFNRFEIVNIIETFSIAYISERPFNNAGRRLINAQDTLSNKFFDYIMMGKPVIINAKGEISRLMKKRKFGFYINDKHEESLKNLILELKNNNNLRRTLGLNAKKLAEKFDRDLMAERMESIFERYV